MIQLRPSVWLVVAALFSGGSIETTAPLAPPTVLASSPSKPPTDTAVLRWPPPPERERIRYLRSLDPTSVRARPSLVNRFFRALVGPTPEPEMGRPYGVGVGPDQRVYVADTEGGVIHVYDTKKSSYQSLHLDARSLVGIAFGGQQMFVTDSAAGRVMGLDLKGHVRWTRGSESGFGRPTGLVATDDRLYVVDTTVHRIVVMSLSGAILRSFGGRGTGPGQFNFPTNIARASNGRLYVTDSMNFRVQIFDADERPVTAFGQLGDALGDFDKPKGIAVDGDGHIYVVEGLHDIVQMFDESGRLLLAFGGSGTGAGQLWLPSGIAISHDLVFVADSANRRIELFQHRQEGP